MPITVDLPVESVDLLWERREQLQKIGLLLARDAEANLSKIVKYFRSKIRPRDTFLILDPGMLNI